MPGLGVRVVAGARPYRPPSGLGRIIAGPALAAADVEADADADAGAGVALGAADVVLDLTASCAASDVAGARDVWRFRIGVDDDPAAPFVREIAGGAESVEVHLLRCSGSSRACLRRGRFPVTRWHPRTLRWALLEAARWPAILAARLSAGAAVSASPSADPAARRAAPWTLRAKFAFVVAGRLAGFVVEELFERTEWNVGFAPGGARALLAPAPLEVRWLPRPAPGAFIADPFVVERDGRRVVLVEEFDPSLDRGVIAAIELGANGEEIERRRIVETATHLSYPYPLEIDGTLFIVPESSAAHEVALYRCVAFPWQWQRERALLPATDGIDTTVFAHDGRWWALCGLASRGSNFALYAFHASSPAGPWTAHPLNPVVEDVTRARPAGRPFVVDGVMYRPGQDCAHAYGTAVSIARVDVLTPDDYRETVVNRIAAHGFGRYADGVHTVGVTSGGIVVDGKRTARDPRKPLSLARNRLRR